MSAILPSASILVAVFATAVPWGLPADATFMLPLVVVMMVFCWRTIPGAVLPPTVAMLLGLLTDVTSGGPLGFWGLMALIAASVGGWAPSLADEPDELGLLWLVWVAVAVLRSGFGWLLASLYFFRWIDWWPIAIRALASIVLFPVVLRACSGSSAGGSDPAATVRAPPMRGPASEQSRPDPAGKQRLRFSRRVLLVGAGRGGPVRPARCGACANCRSWTPPSIACSPTRTA